MKNDQPGQADHILVRLRSFVAEDLQAIQRLDLLCFREGISYSLSEMVSIVRRKGSFCILAEDPAGILAGFAIGELPARGRGQRGQVITIDVDPHFRRHGVGRMLMQALEDELVERGALQCSLEVAVDDPGAEAFYAGLGYVVLARIEGYYMGLVDAMVMEKLLVTPKA